MSQDINYPIAAIGAILGGVVGALAWWGLTVLTKIGFGLVAVVIGLLVGHGTLRFAGGKRSVGLQVMAVAVGALSFLVAVYLVNMTFINQALPPRGEAWRVGLPPSSGHGVFQGLAADLRVLKIPLLRGIRDQA